MTLRRAVLRCSYLFAFLFSLPAVTSAQLNAPLQAGDIVVAEAFGQARLVKVDPVTGARTVISAGGLFSESMEAYGLAVDHEGQLIVAERYFGDRSRVIRVDPVTGAQVLVTIGERLGKSWGLVVDRNGDYLVGAFMNHFDFQSIVRVNPLTGAQSSVAVDCCVHHIGWANGIAFDPRGRLIATSTEGGVLNVTRVNLRSGALTPLGARTLAEGPAAAAVAVATNGDIYVADGARTGGITRLDAATGVNDVVAMNATSDPNSTFGETIGIALDFFTDDLLIAENSGGRVIRLNLSTGQQTVLSNGSTRLTAIYVVRPPMLPDLTPPTLSCGAPDGLWHATDIQINCTASDSDSGLADDAQDSFTLGTSVQNGSESASAATNSVEVCDAEGNCATAAPIAGNKIDKRPPAIMIQAPASMAYTVGAVVAADYECNPGDGAPLAVCSGTLSPGQAVPTSAVGTFSFTVSAADAAGNSAQHSVQYAVEYVVPSITWNVQWVAGTVLDERALNGTADVAGTFIYDPPAGTVLAPGPNVLSMHFEPGDSARYSAVDRQVSVWVVAGPFAEPIARLQTSPGWGAEAAIDEVRNRIYIPEQRSGGSLIVVDGETNAIIDRLTISKNGWEPQAMGVAFDASANRVYVTSGEDSGLWVFDANSLQQLEFIDLPNIHGSVTVNPSTGLVYAVPLNVGQEITVVNPSLPASAAERVSTLHIDSCVYHLDFNPQTSLLYAGSAAFADQCALTVIDAQPASPTYHTVLGTLPMYSPSAFAVNRRSSSVYVLGYDGRVEDGGLGHVMVIDGVRSSETFHGIVDDIAFDLNQVGQGHIGNLLMTGIDVNPITNRVYAHLGGWAGGVHDSLTIIDAATNEVLSMSVLPFTVLGLSNFSPFVVNPVTSRLYVGNSEETLVLEDRVIDALPTEAAAEPVTVTSSQASISFSEVSVGGVTQVEPVVASSIDLPLPGGFVIDGAQAYEVTTTASVVAPITLCFNVSSVGDPDEFAQLRVLHGEDGVLVDRTSSHDFTTGTICAVVDSLSPFVIARSVDPVYSIVRFYDSTKSHKAGSTAPIKIQIMSADGINASSAALVVQIVDLRLVSTQTSAEIVDAGQSSPDYNFRFDAHLGGTGGYTFNLKTKGMATGSYEMLFTIGEGQRRYVVPIQVR